MEANKENVLRTRIPIPKDPLPALPRHLLFKNEKVLNDNEKHQPTRRPLETINSQIEARPGPSKELCKEIQEKPRNSKKIDTRHVTMRTKKENLDWDYRVFKDKENKVVDAEVNVITINDDELYLEDEEGLSFIENIKKNNLGDALSAVTPNFKDTLEPNRVRNIKRSLKRPHSRELQGFSLAKHDKIDEKTKRSYDRLQDELGAPDYWGKAYMKCMNRQYTIDIMTHLVAMERKPMDVPRTSCITRACVINWLMKVNGAHGNPAVVQSACWYLDSVLGTGHVHLNKLQLIAAACYWISQKLHGPVSSAMRLVRYANKAFTGVQLLAAERAVLLRLKFPSQPVVAQDFITYFSWWSDKENGGEIEIAATFLCQCGLLVDKVLCDEYPSVIAAAAVRNALLLLDKRELIALLQRNIIFQTVEKKAANLGFTCSILRRAIRMVSSAKYEYKAPLELHGGPPDIIAYTVNSAAKLAVIDARNTGM